MSPPPPRPWWEHSLTSDIGKPVPRPAGSGKEALGVGVGVGPWEVLEKPLLPLVGGLTCPERGRLPVLVVVGKAREARHAARVVVLQPLQQLPKFLLALLLPQQPHLVLLLQPLPTAHRATPLTPPSGPHLGAS